MIKCLIFMINSETSEPRLGQMTEHEEIWRENERACWEISFYNLDQKRFLIWPRVEYNPNWQNIDMRCRELCEHSSPVVKKMVIDYM